MENIYAQGIADRAVTFVFALFAAFLAAGLTFVLLYFIIILLRLRKREQLSLEMVTVEVKLPKENEIKVDAAEQMFASFASLKNEVCIKLMVTD